MRASSPPVFTGLDVDKIIYEIEIVGDIQFEVVYEIVVGLKFTFGVH
jgi:hypothetical protein